MENLSSSFTKKAVAYLLTIALSVSAVSLFSLHSAKADSITPTTTTSYGSYYVDTYFQQSGSSVVDGWTIVLPFIEININNANSTVYHLHYDFNNKYDGYINVTVTSARSWVLNDCDLGVEGGWFMSLPASSTSSASKTFRIGLSGSQTLDFYIVHKSVSTTNVVFNLSTTYSISYTLSMGMTDNELLDHIDTMLMTNATYQIDIESIPAWAFFQPDYDHVSYAYGDIYPHIIFASGYQSKTFRLEADEEVVLYAYMSTDLACSMYQSRFTLTTSRLEQYKISGMSLYIIKMKNNTSASTTDRLQFDYSGTCIPIYYGYEENMPDSLCNMFGIETKTESYLRQILDAILNGGSSVPTFWLDTWDDIMTSVNRFINTITINNGTGAYATGVETDIRDKKQTFITDGDDTHGNWWTVKYLADEVFADVSTYVPTLPYLATIGLTIMILRLFL